MPETLSQRQHDMCRVLRHIQARKPFDDLSYEDRRILLECYEAHYFDGIVILQMISGNVVAEYQQEPRLTYAGLQFLEEHDVSASTAKDSAADDNEKSQTGMQKAFQVVIAFIRRFWKLFCGLGVIVGVFGWPLILDFFSFLVSLFQ